jgi:hypothetical protein
VDLKLVVEVELVLLVVQEAEDNVVLTQQKEMVVPEEHILFQTVQLQFTMLEVVELQDTQITQVLQVAVDKVGVVKVLVETLVDQVPQVLTVKQIKVVVEVVQLHLLLLFQDKVVKES